MKRLALVTACGFAGTACGTFEDPNVVIDLRVLAMTATPPEQVVDLVPGAMPADLLAQLVPARVCALIADRNFDRRLRYTLTMCALSTGDRCNLSAPHALMAQGVLEDPDTAVPAPELCGDIPVDGNLLGVLLDALGGDTLHGIGGIYYGVELRVGGEDADPALDQYAAKSLRVSPRVPATITANTNPTMSGVKATVDGGLESPIDLARCIESIYPLELAPEQKVRFTPLEPDGVREVYDVPTIDGTSRTFTESLTYQWVSSAGKLSKGDTGGPRDPFGNPAPLFTDFTAPHAEDLDGPTLIPLWIVQRDERLGAAWFEACIRVTP